MHANETKADKKISTPVTIVIAVVAITIVIAVVAITLITFVTAIKTIDDRWRFVSAAKSGDVKEVRRFLDAGMRPDTKSIIGGIRAISMASYGGQIEVVQLLLDEGANPTYGLPQAVLMNRVEIVKLLIRKGADVNHWKGYEDTPLEFAKERGNEAIISELKKAGAK